LKTNWVREKLRAGQPCFGCFMGLGSPNVAELLGHAGCEWLAVETEHNGLDSAEIERMLMAIGNTHAIPLVRVACANSVYIQRALDMGAMGVVVPLIRTPEEARAVVRATRYPPYGSRGFGPLRASQYTLDNEDYFRRANDNTLVVLILETKEAVENLEEICAVPGVDALYIGPFDLCLSLGLDPMYMPFPETEAVIQRALTVGRKSGVAIGTGARTPELLRQRLSQGFTFLGYGPDYVLLLNAIRSGVSTFAELVPDPGPPLEK